MAVTDGGERPPARRPVYRLGVAAILLAAAFLLLLHSFDARYTTGLYASAPNAMVLPRVLLALWAGLAAAVCVVEWRRPAGSGGERLSTPIWLTLILLAAAVVLPFSGFGLMIPVAIGASLVAMGERRPLVLVGATALLGPALWFIFHHVLLIRLPSILPGGLL